MLKEDIELVRHLAQEEIAAAGADLEKNIKELDLKYGKTIQAGLEKVAEDSEVALDSAVRVLEAKIKKVADAIPKASTKTSKK